MSEQPSALPRLTPSVSEQDSHPHSLACPGRHQGGNTPDPCLSQHPACSLDPDRCLEIRLTMDIEETEPQTDSTSNLLSVHRRWPHDFCGFPLSHPSLGQDQLCLAVAGEKKSPSPVALPPSGFLARSRAGGPIWYPAGTYANNQSLAVCASYMWTRSSVVGERGAGASGHREVGSGHREVGSVLPSALTSHPSVRGSLDPGERRATEVNVERR